MTLDGSERNHYVYVIFRPSGVPCYVGKGKGGRWLDHVRNARNPHLASIYAKAGGNLPIVKIREQLTNDESCMIEVALIAAIGRNDRGRGPLANMTDGGDGLINPSLETRAKISASLRGKIQSEETKEKRAASRRGQRHSIETLVKMSAWQKGKKRSPLSDETRAKISASLTGRKVGAFTDAHRAKLSEAAKMRRIGRSRSAETRAKIAATLKARHRASEHQGQPSATI